MGLYNTLCDKARRASDYCFKDALIVTNIYKEPKGASPAQTIFGIPISWGSCTQRIEIGHSKYFRFAIQIIGDEIRQRIIYKEYVNHKEWRILRVLERQSGEELEVLVSVTSIAKRIGASAEMVRAASNAGNLEALISRYTKETNA